MADVPLITIIVPIYRAEAYLRRCVDSILGQDFRDLELILIDDGSPDGCPGLCDAFAESDSRVVAIHQKNKGVSAARNTGLDAARGEYVAFVDADDWVEPDYLSYLVHLQEEGNASISACNHYVTAGGRDTAKFPVSREVCSLSQKTAYSGLLYHQPPDASAWGKLYARSLFDQLRYPEGHVFEDTWMIANLLERAGTLVYGAEPKYHYVYRAGTISKSASRDQMWDFWDAVCHLTEIVLRSYPDLSPGCTRRRVHAALSIRRLLVHADASAGSDIERCRSIIRENAKDVLIDPRAPLRDKAGILLSLAGPGVFDAAWEFYHKRRRDF